jgi:CDP-diacylglycerol--serine O-phosphatidyltransferase
MMPASPAAAFHRRNLVTYASLASGVAAIAVAGHGIAPAAGALMALAVLADTFDGRYARRFQASTATREIGAELDSLADAVSFAAAPVVCLALVSRPEPGWVALAWWIAAAVYIACGVTRLAFFNVCSAKAAGFVGVPVPAAALIWSTVLIAPPSSVAAAGLFVVCAIAMVVPLRIPRPTGFGLAVFACWPIGLVAIHALTLLR